MGRDAAAFEVKARDGNDRAPGSYSFLHYEGKRIGIVHACPCGCGRHSALFFRGYGLGRPEWDVNGEWPKVTLSPSIGIGKQELGGFHWHGFLEDGVFVEK